MTSREYRWINRDGEISGKLTLLVTHHRMVGKKSWMCLVRCECGVEKEIHLGVFHRTKSCGKSPCREIYESYEDLTGKTFNFLEVVRHSSKTNNHMQKVDCICLICGNEKNGVLATRVKNGIHKSCGCYDKNLAIFKNSKHLLCRAKTPNVFYKRLSKILDRCNKPHCVSYKNYGELGVTVWEHWASLEASSVLAFKNYLLEIEPNVEFLLKNGYELDRINSFGNYEPGNLAIASPLENAYNKRNSKMVIFDGTAYTKTNLYREFKRRGYKVKPFEEFIDLLKKGISIDDLERAWK